MIDLITFFSTVLMKSATAMFIIFAASLTVTFTVAMIARGLDGASFFQA